MYAILDIETTGGRYNEEGITEIAIYRFDGHEIVDQFASLINPERPIQPFVQNLTGINNEMIRRAPKFYQVAKRIVEITSDCVIVAHNALFDHRILRTEFDRLGYQFERETLCTVELSKKILPDLPSYSLGKLVKHLGIPLSDRHRAQGDAKATVALFKLLLDKDQSKEIISQHLKTDTKKQPEQRLLALAERAPADVGVYYLYNAQNKLIYIGRAKNIRKRLLQHFTYDNRKSLRLQKEVASVSYELTGNELLARLKELEEIKRNKPPYNRKIVGNIYTHQLDSTVDAEGYVNLKLEKADGRKKALLTFNNLSEATATLLDLVQEHDLCPKRCDLADKISKDVLKTLLKSNACNESQTSYNRRVKDALEEKSLWNKNVLLIDRGRNVNERSLIWVANGKVNGYGFYNLNHQISQSEILSNISIQVGDIRNTTHLVQQYLLKDKIQKIVPLAPQTVSEVLNQETK